LCLKPTDWSKEFIDSHVKKIQDHLESLLPESIKLAISLLNFYNSLAQLKTNQKRLVELEVSLTFIKNVFQYCETNYEIIECFYKYISFLSGDELSVTADFFSDGK
jgi:hypothetical protein